VANNGTAFVANGSGAVVRFGGSVITGNTSVVSTVSGGTVTSYKTNQVDGNANNNTPIAGSGLN
jgi:hypothetical protein